MMKHVAESAATGVAAGRGRGGSVLGRAQA